MIEESLFHLVAAFAVVYIIYRRRIFLFTPHRSLPATDILPGMIFLIHPVAAASHRRSCSSSASPNLAIVDGRADNHHFLLA